MKFITASSWAPKGVGIMKRTTVVLSDQLAALLDYERRKRGVSTAALIRDALESYLGPSAQPPRLRFAALGRSGYRDTAATIDQILEREWTLDRIKG